MEPRFISELTGVELEVDSPEDRSDDVDDRDNCSKERKCLRFGPTPVDMKGDCRFEKILLPFMARRLGTLVLTICILMVRPRRAKTEGAGVRVIVVGDGESNISVE